MQHRELLTLVTDLDAMDPESSGQRAILGMLDRVLDFAFSHFEMEETLMVRVDYTPQDHVEMAKHHSEFKSYARLRVLEFRFGEITSTEPFVPFLHEWLTDHEFGLDRRLAAFIRATRQTATAHADMP